MSVREDLVSAGSFTRGMGVACRFVVRRSKLLGDSADVEPGLVVEVLREGGNLRRDRDEVTKNESRSFRVGKFLNENSSENAVGLCSSLSVCGSTGVSIGIVGSGVELVVEV